MEAVFSIALIALIGTLAIMAIASYLSKQVDVGGNPNSPDDIDDDGVPNDVGAPLFRTHDNVLGKKCPLDKADIGDEILVPCRYGVLTMKVARKVSGIIELENDHYLASAYMDDNYLSQTVADKYAISNGCYRLKGIRIRPNSGFRPPRPENWRKDTHQWIECDSIFGLTGDDLLDLLVVYYFLFDGFDQPYDYYHALDPMDPSMAPENWDEAAGELVQEEPVAEEPAPEEPLQEEPVAEEPAPEYPQPEPEPEPETAPEPTNIPTYEPPTPDPEPEPAPPPEPTNIPTYEPPPAPDPEPYDSGGYDSGSSDFGGSDDSW